MTASSAPQLTDNPLSKDLPGLPIEFRNVRIDETGFHRAATRFRPEAHFAWEQVTAIRPGLISVTVEGSREPEDRIRTLARVWTSRAQIRRAAEAWKEYRLRVLERDGVLKGTSDCPGFRWAYWAMLVLSLFFAATAMTTRILFVRAMRRFDQIPRVLQHSDDPTIHEIADMAREVVAEHFEEMFFGRPHPFLEWGAPVMFLAFAVLSLVLAVAMRRRARRWKRWEFSSEGFAFWPEGQRQTLGASERVRMALWRFRGLRIGRDGNELLVHIPVAWPVFLALNERSGRRPRWSLAWDFTGAALVAVVMVAAFFLEIRFEGSEGADLWLKIPRSLALVSVFFWLPLWMHSKTKRALAEGREMLKRLGW